MARYLVIAYQTAEEPALLERLRQIAEEGEEVSYVLLVPATPSQHLRLATAGESYALAQEAMKRAQSRFHDEGLDLVSVRVSDPNPIVAASEELIAFPDYDGMIVSTFPPGVSRWLKLDVVSRLQRMTSIPVIHVVARSDPDQS